MSHGQKLLPLLLFACQSAQPPSPAPVSIPPATAPVAAPTQPAVSECASFATAPPWARDLVLAIMRNETPPGQRIQDEPKTVVEATVVVVREMSAEALREAKPYLVLQRTSSVAPRETKAAARCIAARFAEAVEPDSATLLYLQQLADAPIYCEIAPGCLANEICVKPCCTPMAPCDPAAPYCLEATPADACAKANAPNCPKCSVVGREAHCNCG